MSRKKEEGQQNQKLLNCRRSQLARNAPMHHGALYSSFPVKEEEVTSFVAMRASEFNKNCGQHALFIHTYNMADRSSLRGTFQLKFSPGD